MDRGFRQAVVGCQLTLANSPSQGANLANFIFGEFRKVLSLAVGMWRRNVASSLKHICRVVFCGTDSQVLLSNAPPVIARVEQLGVFRNLKSIQNNPREAMRPNNLRLNTEVTVSVVREWACPVPAFRQAIVRNLRPETRSDISPISVFVHVLIVT
jgi:hypothetical protein